MATNLCDRQTERQTDNQTHRHNSSPVLTLFSNETTEYKNRQGYITSLLETHYSLPNPYQMPTDTDTDTCINADTPTWFFDSQFHVWHTNFNI